MPRYTRNLSFKGLVVPRSKEERTKETRRRSKSPTIFVKNMIDKVKEFNKQQKEKQEEAWRLEKLERFRAKRDRFLKHVEEVQASKPKQYNEQGKEYTIRPSSVKDGVPQFKKRPKRYQPMRYKNKMTTVAEDEEIQLSPVVDDHLKIDRTSDMDESSHSSGSSDEESGYFMDKEDLFTFQTASKDSEEVVQKLHDEHVGLENIPSSGSLDLKILDLDC